MSSSTTMSSTADPTSPDPASQPDAVATRLQARFEMLESFPEMAEPTALRRPPRPTALRRPPREEVGPVDPTDPAVVAANVEDLNHQLEMLREQLEHAIAEIESGAVAGGRAEQAERRAQSAEILAVAADARIGDVLAAVEEMRSTFDRPPAMSSAKARTRLMDALDRLRERLNTGIG